MQPEMRTGWHRIGALQRSWLIGLDDIRCHTPLQKWETQCRRRREIRDIYYVYCNSQLSCVKPIVPKQY